MEYEEPSLSSSSPGLLVLLLGPKHAHLVEPDHGLQVVSVALLYNGHIAVVPGGTDTEHRLLGFFRGDQAVITGVKRLEGRLELGVVIHLLVEVDGVHDGPVMSEDHCGLVQLGDLPQQMKGSDIPDLSEEN